MDFLGIYWYPKFHDPYLDPTSYGYNYFENDNMNGFTELKSKKSSSVKSK
jgi:hypothetical protein